MFSIIKIDKLFLIITTILLGGGFLIFCSASMGLLARSGADFSTVAIKQILVGFVGGGIIALITTQIPYTFYKKYAFYIFAASVIATLLVFVPHIGFSHGGAARWITIFHFNVQPSELLKFGFIVYVAAWLSKNHQKNHLFKKGLVPLIVIFGIVSAVMLAQPDTDTLITMLVAGGAMYFVSGASWKHIGLLAVIGLIGFTAVVFMRPYVMQRITTFFHPTNDTRGSAYQINQSLIAIGSGGFLGRGFGQSIQKFNYLPEPIGDSIFAVAAEEFGFVGSVILLLLFLSFTLRGLYISSNSPDMFGRLVVLGIIIVIIIQSITNISSMLGIIPLSGIPLIFISQGGTSMVIALAEIGVILNISKY